MKTEILLLSFFAHVITAFSLISATVYPQTLETNAPPLKNTSEDRKQDTHAVSKDIVSNEIKFAKDSSQSSIYPDYERMENDANAFKKQSHSLKIKPERMKNQHEHPFRERSGVSGMPTLQRNLNYLQQLFYNLPERRGINMEPYYPPFYRRKHFADYGRSAYHPYFYSKAYGIHNFGKRYIDQREHLNKFLHDHQGHYYSEQDFMSPYSEEIAMSSKTVPLFFLQTPTNADRIMRSSLADSENITNLDTLDMPSDISNIQQDLLNKPYRKFGNPEEITSEILIDLRTRNYPRDRRQLTTDSGRPPKAENSTLNIYSQVFDIGKSNESNNASLVQRAQGRLQPSGLMDDLHARSVGLPASNRVYFEKIPLNTNVSWFVYVNCSRDRCQFVNNTNETELISEGWILHNCTSYGCTEMYPKTESVQRFIGLLLLVFSLCILKIVVFLLVFYYCRHLKLSKHATEDRDPSWDEEKFDSYIAAKKKDNKIKNTVKDAENGKPTSSQKKENEYKISPVKENRLHSSNERENEEINSKVWVPPVQKVSPCVLPAMPVGNILIPKQALEKKIPDTKVSAVPKSRKKIRSSIPRLEKWAKYGGKDGAKHETKTIEKNIMQNVTKPDEKEDRDVLLVNLDEEITSNFYSPGSLLKSPLLKCVFENDNKSFISLDLSGEK